MSPEQPRRLVYDVLSGLAATAATLLLTPAVSIAAQAPMFGAQLPVGAVTRTTATVSANLNPEGSPTSYEVLFGMTSVLGEHTAEVKAGGGSSEETVRVGLSGLVPGTTYHYEFAASNGDGTTTGPEATFTTAPATPPALTTGQASDITLTTATVTGTIDPQGLPTSYELDFGASTTYGTSIFGEAGSADEDVSVAVNLQNLAPGVTYHYRIDAINSDGRVYGHDQTFTTPAYSKPITLPAAPPQFATPRAAVSTEGTGTAKQTVKKHKKHKKHKHGKRQKRKSKRRSKR